MQVDLAGKFALVTGAARGIGCSIADTLTANGATVAYADIDFATVKQTAAKSPRSLAVEMDISDEARVDSAMAEVLKKFGRRHPGEQCRRQHRQASREHRPVPAGGMGKNREG